MDPELWGFHNATWVFLTTSCIASIANALPSSRYTHMACNKLLVMFVTIKWRKFFPNSTYIIDNMEFSFNHHTRNKTLHPTHNKKWKSQSTMVLIHHTWIVLLNCLKKIKMKNVGIVLTWCKMWNKEGLSLKPKFGKNTPCAHFGVWCLAYAQRTNTLHITRNKHPNYCVHLAHMEQECETK